MKKIFRLEDLDCAACAAKMEDAIARVPGVSLVQVNFLRQAMTLEAPDELFDGVVAQAQKIMRKIEPDVRVVG